MAVNVLNALMNLGTYLNNDIKDIYSGSNRMNSQGTALEFYVKDAYCNAFDTENIEEKIKIHEQYFSYLGNDSNPPDFVIKDGEGVEVKKLESLTGQLQLNSSYPKNKLRQSDSRISNECRTCDGGKWIEKDMMYSIGFIPKNSNEIKLLWFVDGEVYAADDIVYKNVFERLSSIIETEFKGLTSKTNELARFNKIDSRGLTDLRVRSMWLLQNPIKAFKDIILFDKENEFSVIAIIKKEKYETYANKEEFEQFVQNSSYVEIENVTIPHPTNANVEEQVVVIHMAYKSLEEAREVSQSTERLSLF
ncbi:NgoPII family restriction endonuclease [Bacillus sp. WLY-B-L8]|uniref:NgoPII family restriction endonuclease n=1 Tax=Bacillus multifaciens TaxID=3068506 RepID=UPI002741B1F2|nr:NgoPII family restriction endonuclease [Bacillus sp. WLY-B-L8]MDP7980338.1 NgoPII family restriction endonuclease [Bacillus sp. WLY-B-L8]